MPAPKKKYQLPQLSGPSVFDGLTDEQIKQNMAAGEAELERRRNLQEIEVGFNDAMEYAENPVGRWAVRISPAPNRLEFVTIGIHEGHYLDVLAKVSDLFNITNLELSENTFTLNLIRADKLNMGRIKEEPRSFLVQIPEGMKLSGQPSKIVDSVIGMWLQVASATVRNVKFACSDRLWFRFKRSKSA